MLRLPVLARCAAAAGLLVATTACENLYIASQSDISLSASVNSTRTSGSLSLGYGRDFLVLVPKSVKVTDVGDADANSGTGGGADANGRGGETPEREAMSAVSCTDFETEGIFITKFEQKLATGRAAKQLMNTMSGHGDPLFKMSCFTVSHAKGQNGSNAGSEGAGQ